MKTDELVLAPVTGWHCEAIDAGFVILKLRYAKYRVEPVEPGNWTRNLLLGPNQLRELIAALESEAQTLQATGRIPGGPRPDRD